jgi:hypothetical protein
MRFRTIETRLDEAREWGDYTPAQPFPDIQTEDFRIEVRYILEATKSFIDRVFEYKPTIIELSDFLRISNDVASYYARHQSDTETDKRITHIPLEVFCRFLMEQGWDARMSRRVLKIPNEERWLYLQHEQSKAHHEA